MAISGTGHAQDEQADSTTVTLEAPDRVDVGEVIVLTLRVEEAVAIGGFEAHVLYSHEVGEFAGFSPLAAQGEHGQGRLVAPELTTGSAVGFYTCSTEPCLTQREVQAQSAAENGSLAEIELLALAGGELEIRLEHVQLVDPAGQSIAVALPQSSVVVQVDDDSVRETAAQRQRRVAPASGWTWAAKATEVKASAATADVTSDGQVTHGDVMEVAIGWQITREEGTPCGGSEMAADVNGDGCVDITDVQLAAAFADDMNTPDEPPVQISPHQLYLPLLMAQAAAFDIESADTAVRADSELTFIVNSTLDEGDAQWGNGICRSASGVCTLRAAIAEANANSGGNEIAFAIPGGGTQTIQLTSRLPTLWDSTGGTLIDGYSQPGAVPNTDPVVSNAQIRIQIRGNGAEAFDGLVITSGEHVVQGLAFFNLRRSLWIYGPGAHDNVIVGNFVGTNATGTFKATATSSMQAHGIQLEQGAMHNQIGGVLAAERNIISGNGRHGIGFWHVGTRDNAVLNNLVGLSPEGTQQLPNRVHGVDINYGASYNTVGGTKPGERNVLSGNNGRGAEISHGKETTQNAIIGNYIGTDVSGSAGPAYSANESYGVSVKDRVVYNSVSDNVIANNAGGGIAIDNLGNCCASHNTFQNNRIGIGVNGEEIGNEVFGMWVFAPLSQIGPGNIIAYNPAGILIEGNANDDNMITQNSIFGNTGLGIDLAPIGQVNANDPDDLDTGPNQQLNYPVLENAWPSQVVGTVCPNCIVEIFIADGGAEDYGEGRTLIGTETADGNGAFSVQVNGAKEGDYVTATATDATGNTSEFSLNRLVAAPQPWEQVFAIPGRIEAEDYRVGGAGIGYTDTTAGNSGRVYRSDDVDIAVTQDNSGNYNVGWIAGGEWLAYDVNVATTGTYQFIARVATPKGGRRFHVEVDGNNVSGSVIIPWTGGWQNWVNVTVSIPLTAGPHVLRFVAETPQFNVNYYDISIR